MALCVRLTRRTSARKLGQYILGAQIGAGNIGAVYSARHATLGHGAAIKVLHPERSSARDRARFAREVELTRRLTHANTVSILDSGIGPGGAPYFAMEYVEGVDLQALVEREGPLPPARVIGILSQVSAALSSAHAQGIVHRDIKPANITVTARGAEDHVKLVDFGLARILEARRKAYELDVFWPPTVGHARLRSAHRRWEARWSVRSKAPARDYAERGSRRNIGKGTAARSRRPTGDTERGVSSDPRICQGGAGGSEADRLDPC
jgi:serine/threonine protein kinase